MTKPIEFRETYVLATDVSYRNTDSDTSGTHSSEGTLHQGRVVWLESRPRPTEQASVTAFAEGVGLVTLSTMAIQPMR